MSITSISGTVGAVSSEQKSLNQTFSQQDFFKLLIAQLKYQNPLQPTENNDFMMQVTQFGMLEALQALKTTGDEMLKAEVMQLIGTKVAASLPDNSTVSGTVSSVKFCEGVPYLTVEGQQVRLSQIQEVYPNQDGESVEP